MRIELELDPAETAALIRRAVDEWRPAPMQAEVLLRRSLGLAPPAQASDDRGVPDAGGKEGDA